MVKTDLINRATEVANLELFAARRAVETLFENLGSAPQRGDHMVLRRFGVFQAAPRKTGKARNPRTDEPVSRPRGWAVSRLLGTCALSGATSPRLGLSDEKV